MDHNFGTEIFIPAIEARPAIWVSRAASYSDRVEKTRYWESLCSRIFPDFETKTLAERNELGEE
jgi:hypothetical protein